MAALFIGTPCFSHGQPAVITYSQETETITISAGACGLPDIAAALGNPLVFCWNAEKREAVCSAHLSITGGGRLVIGKESVGPYPWETGWKSWEKLRMRSSDSTEIYGILVDSEGELRVFSSEIVTSAGQYPKIFDIRGGAAIEKSRISEFLILNNRSRKTQVVKDSLVRGCLYPRGISSEVENCRIINENGTGLVFWSTYHHQKEVNNCFIKGKDYDVVVASGYGTLTNCSFDIKRFDITSHDQADGTPFVAEFRAKRELAVELLSEKREPLPGTILKVTGSAGDSSYEYISQPTNAQGRTRVEVTECLITKEGKKGPRKDMFYRNALSMRESGDKDFREIIGDLKPAPDKNEIVIECPHREQESTQQLSTHLTNCIITR